MGRSVRFDTLRELVRTEYDLPTFSTTTFVTTTMVNQWINDAVQKYYGLLIANRDEEFCTYEQTITATANAASYDLSGLTGARFIDVRALHWVRGTDDIVPLERGTLEHLTRRSESAVEWDEDARYCIVRGLLYWLPIPSSSYTVRIWYAGTPTELSADGDTIEGGSNWEQFVVFDVCSRIASREEKDPSVWEVKRESVRQAIESQVRRNKSSTPQVRDRRGALSTTAKIYPFSWWR